MPNSLALMIANRRREMDALVAERNDAIARDYAAGGQATVLAAEYGVSVGGLYGILRRAGVPLRFDTVARRTDLPRRAADRAADRERTLPV